MSKDRRIEPKFNQVKMDETQTKIINEWTKLFAEALEVSELSIKGFLRRGLKEFQEKRGMTIEDTERGDSPPTPEERIQESKEILEHFEDKMKNMVKFMSDEKKQILHDTLQRALDHYKENYAYR